MGPHDLSDPRMKLQYLIYGRFAEYLTGKHILFGWIPVVLLWIYLYFFVLKRNSKRKLDFREKWMLFMAAITFVICALGQLALIAHRP